MSVQVVELGQVPPQPWRNGGGVTRELLAWPPGSGAGWLVRVSVADIGRDGPFSAFPGVQRGFAVLEGAGVVLGFAAGRELTLTPASAPLHFDGAQAPGCRLVRGPTRDLNLMALASAGEARLQALAGTADRPAAGLRWRGVFTHTPVRLLAGDSGGAIDLPAGCLAWSDAPALLAAAWRLEPQAPQAPRAWSMTLAAPGASRPPG